MNLEKICEYLSEIGILGYENINTFLNIYSKLNKQNYSHKENKIIETLKIYLTNNFIKNNQVSKLCASIISSYINYQLILKFQSLNNMNNLLLSKLRNKYILFFLNLSFEQDLSKQVSTALLNPCIFTSFSFLKNNSAFISLSFLLDFSKDLFFFSNFYMSG